MHRTIKLQFDWREWVSKRYDTIRRRKPTLSEEGMQQLEQEINASSAQTILSNNDLTHNIQSLNRQVSGRQGEIDAYRVVDEYSKIVLRSIEINKEVFQMALGIKEDVKMVLQERIGELKKGQNKSWIVASQMAGWAVFFLLYILFKQFFISMLGLALP